MKDYYKILQVSRQASSEEIKKSYRKLALMYHPDRNSDPSAAVVIKELNEAYEVLGDEIKRRNYNYRYDYRSTNTSTTNSTRTNYSRPPKTPPQKKYYQKVKYDFASWARIARIFSAFFVLYCGLLTLDFVLSSNYENVVADHVTGIKHTTGRKVDYTTYHIISEKINFTLSTSCGISPGDKFYFQITPLFGIVRNCKALTKSSYYGESFNVEDATPIEVFNIYSPIFFVVIVSLATGLVSILTKSHEQSITLSIVSFFFFVITLFMVNQP